MLEREHLQDLLKTAWSKLGHFQRIENVAGTGCPDINLCFDGAEVWIETKIGLDRYGQPNLRPAQKAWHTRRYMNGGLVYVMTRHYEVVYLHQYSAELAACVLLRSYTMPLNYKAILQYLVAPAEV